MLNHRARKQVGMKSAAPCDNPPPTMKDESPEQLGASLRVLMAVLSLMLRKRSIWWENIASLMENLGLPKANSPLLSQLATERQIKGRGHGLDDARLRMS